MLQSAWAAPTAEEVRVFVTKLQNYQIAAASMDVRAHCFRFDEERFRVEVREPLIRLLLEVRETISVISARCDPPKVHKPSADEVEEAWFEQTGSLIPPGMEAQLFRRVGDACFAARHELGSDALTSEVHDRDDELSRADSTRRRLRRALTAVLRALSDAVPGMFPLPASGADDLESSIAVRAAYARFRRALPACDPHAPDSVSRALRLCAVSFAVLLGSLEAGDLRVRDQRLLRQLQERLFAWAQGRRDTLEGVRLHRDIVSTAELLRAINMRQELRENDAKVISSALSAPPKIDDEQAVRRWIGRLSELRGRDDELDTELRAAGSQLADPRARVDAICRCLEQLSPKASPEAGTFF